MAVLKSLTIQVESSSDETGGAMTASTWWALCSHPTAACLFSVTTQTCSVFFKMNIPVVPNLLIIMQILTVFPLKNLWRKDGGMPQWTTLSDIQS